MIYICDHCGEKFPESEAEIGSYDIEESLGISSFFPSSTTGYCYHCPACGSDCIKEYSREDEEEEEEEEDDEE